MFTYCIVDLKLAHIFLNFLKFILYLTWRCYYWVNSVLKEVRGSQKKKKSPTIHYRTQFPIHYTHGCSLYIFKILSIYLHIYFSLQK